ncbi:Histone deacetylase [Paragonimus heterotremus]|uniref:histone deacetylase n=1 Tax=Paragonimus heterotremus TaxID=100268 RepID=A0A8J4TCA3_9TREM|nr:Histone deacetylase [Paragonimus heterotremus]
MLSWSPMDERSTVNSIKRTHSLAQLNETHMTTSATSLFSPHNPTTSNASAVVSAATNTRLVRSAIMSRQPSFDQEVVDGPKSSTQVKQLLKNHVLNRRRRYAAADRNWHEDDKPHVSSMPHTYGNSFGHRLSPSHDQSPEFLIDRRVGHWHSADSTNSIDLESNCGSMTRALDGFHQCCRTSTTTGEHQGLPVYRRASVTGSFVSHNQTPEQPGINEDQQLLLLDVLERLTAHVALSEHNDEAGAKQNPLLTPLEFATRLGSDIRKTTSESNLFDGSWPLRLVSQLLCDPSMQSGDCIVPEAQSVHTINSLPSECVPMVPARRLSSDRRRNSSSLQAQVLHMLNSMAAMRRRRSTALEPLVEPPFRSESVDLSTDRVLDTQNKVPVHLSSRSVQSNAHVDSILTRATNEAQWKTCLVGPNRIVDAEKPQGFLKTTRSLDPKFHLVGSAANCPTVLSRENEEMDWETDVDSPPVYSCNDFPKNLSKKPSRVDLAECPNTVRSIILDSAADRSRILSRWFSVPVEDWTCTLVEPFTRAPVTHCLPTALAFDPSMLEHTCVCPNALDLTVHPECPDRMWFLLARLMHTYLQVPCRLSRRPAELLRVLQAAVAVDHPALQHGLANLTDLNPSFLLSLLARVPLIHFCQLVRARMATEEELCLFHSKDHVITFGSILDPVSSNLSSLPVTTATSVAALASLSDSSSSSSDHAQMVFRLAQRLCKLNCGGFGVDSDTVWNPSTTARAARLAVGQVLCLAHKVASNQLRNGFALIRPPGHHAEPDQAMGFCYFNAVAVAAMHLLRSHGLGKVLILDWDIHHGNGTKLATSLHPGLVYVSIHRYDAGTFFPGTGPVNDQLTTSSTKHSRPDPDKLIENCQQEVRGFSHLDCAQLINVAWEVPADQTRMTSHPMDAGNRRAVWRQYYTRRKQRGRLDPRLSKDPDCAPTNSTGSLYSGTSARATNSIRCFCRSGPGADGASSGSSQPCSICLSNSMRSSLSSSVQSVSSFHSQPPTTTYPTNRIPVELPQRPCTHQQPNRRPLLGLSDAEYLAAMRCVVLPVAHEFQPDMILISAGFDAASGHGEALGGYAVSPGTFAWITRQCMALVNGRVVLALEGGYNPEVVSECVAACLNALLLPTPSTPWSPNLQLDPKHPPSSATVSAQSFDPEAYSVDAFQTACDWISTSELDRQPCPEAVANLLSTIRHQARSGWRCMQQACEENVGMSFSTAMQMEQQLVNQRRVSSASEKVPTDSTAWYSCGSPLTTGLAQLHMDQS